MEAKGLVLIFALLIAGCAGMQIPGLPGMLPAEAEHQQVLELIGYAQRVAAMSAEEQRTVYAADNQAFAKDKSAFSRVRLALLLATPGASVRDDARAAGLLEPLAAQDDHASPMQLLASLMYSQIAERQREQKRLEQMRQKVESEHQKIEAERQKIESERQRDQKQVEQMRQQIEAERQRDQKQVEQMRQQIEALKSVERAITERVQQGPPRQP